MQTALNPQRPWVYCPNLDKLIGFLWGLKRLAYFSAPVNFPVMGMLSSFITKYNQRKFSQVVLAFMVVQTVSDCNVCQSNQVACVNSSSFYLCFGGKFENIPYEICKNHSLMIPQMEHHIAISCTIA